MKDAIDYKGILLMKGSLAYELYHDKNDTGHIKLDRHMKEVNNRHYELLKRY